jgi:serine/threonine protein kinase
MVEQQTSWIGLRVGDFLVEDQIGEGAFSQVYSGANLSDGKKRAFKVAKSRDALEISHIVEPAPSQAIGLITGGLSGVHPDTVALLSSQVEKIRATNDAALVRIDTLVAEQGFGYYQMELLEGHTLGELIQTHSVSNSTLVEIARVMARLAKNSSFQYHGDLKPENIMIGESGVKILDPGYFGPLECDEGLFDNAAITTPAYYPQMEPDDILAFGLIAWEAELGIHPLLSIQVDDSLAIEDIAPGLFDWVRSYEQVGYYFLSPIYSLPRPTELKPELSAEMEDFLYKAVRVKRQPDGKIEKIPGFNSFDEIAEALIQASPRFD